MKTLRRLLKRLTSWTRRRRDEERLQAEIEEHLAMQTAENVRRGMAPAEARRQAVLKFGGVESMREEYRAQKGLPFLEDLIQDTRYALRRLRKSPAFTMTAVLTLALGIGATTSIFTLVYAVILKTLGVAKPEELYRLGKESRCCYWGGYSQDNEFSLVSHELYRYFRNNTKEFGELAAFAASEQLVGVRRAGRSDPAEVYPEEEVSGNYFAMFGIQPYAGRLFTPSDDRPGAAPVAVMSYRLWHQRYGSDPSVIGSIFNLSDRPFTVVGITPPGFFGDTLRDTPPDFFVPLVTDDTVNEPQTAWLDLIGRIRPGASPVAIEAKMRVELKQWLRSHWGDMSANDRARFAEQTLFLSPGGAGITSMREEYEHWLEIVMTVSGLVLLIICANMANLMLVRGLERRRQTSLSMALGARASRLVREALTESILLALAGGAAGVGMAFAGTSLILHYAFPSIAGLGGIPIDASPSMPVLGFAFVISLVTGVAFGIAPAWMATQTDPIEALRGAGRATARSGSLPRKTLVVLQAALSLVLLSAAGLLIAALGHLENQDFGFRQDRRLVVIFDPRLAAYQPEQLTPLYRQVHESLSSIPGVEAVALSIYTPMSGNNWGAAVWVEGQAHPGPKDDNFVFWNRVTAGYFSAIGDRIVRGRGITEQDRTTTEHVAVINEAFARRFFKKQDPIGKYFGRDENGSHMYRIVGVAKDARYLTFRLDKPVSPCFFLPEEQHDFSPTPGAAEVSPSSHYLREILVVTKPGATVSLPQLRQAMASVDPNLPIIKVRNLSEQVAATFGQQRLIARLTSFFGVLSLVLASIGLYGVTAYNAGRRVSEIGVRMALGANRGQIVALILRGAFRLILFGLVIGLPLTLGAGRFLGSQLYGFHPYDPIVTLVSVATLAVVSVATLAVSALVASLIPAVRSSLAPPMDALRAE